MGYKLRPSASGPGKETKSVSTGGGEQQEKKKKTPCTKPRGGGESRRNIKRKWDKYSPEGGPRDVIWGAEGGQGQITRK